MSKFWQKKYTSKYTGAEIDAAIAKAGTVPAVTSADEGKALVVDSEGKIVPGEAGTTVVANPTLAGTESALTGLQVGETKYKVGGDRVFDDEYDITITATDLTHFVMTLSKTVQSSEKDAYYAEMGESYKKGKDMIIGTISESVVPTLAVGDKIGVIMSGYSEHNNTGDIASVITTFMGNNLVAAKSYTSNTVYFQFAITLA